MDMDNASSPPVKSSSSDLPRRRKEISALIARLLNHYWTADDDPAMRRAQAEDWIEDLVEFDVGDVQNACVEWRRSQHRRPTPADIRLLAIAEHRRQNPTPEPPYIPLPEPREHTAEEIAEVDRKMRAWRRALAETVKHVTEPFHRYEDPEEMRRARIELGLEEEAG